MSQGANLKPHIQMFTDGSAKGNPGQGGFGVILRSGSRQKEISKGFRLTTNNRMELLAVIEGLEALKIQGSIVDIYTDSKYVADAVLKGWVFSWEKKGFAKKKNPDLWIRFLKIYPKFQVQFHWIKGHAGHPENERCDQLAVQAASGVHLIEDQWYISNQE